MKWWSSRLPIAWLVWGVLWWAISLAAVEPRKTLQQSRQLAVTLASAPHTTDTEWAHWAQLARERGALLRQVWEDDPALAESLSLDQATYSALPSHLQTVVEEPFDTTGAWEVICHTPRSITAPLGSTFHYAISWARRRYEAKLSAGQDHPRSRPAVTLRGFLWQNRAYLFPSSFTSTGSSNAARTEPEAYAARGANSCLVIRVDFSDLPGSPVADAPLQEGLASAADFLAESSHQQLDLQFVVTPTLRMPYPTSSYQPNHWEKLKADAETAAAGAGYSYLHYEHEVILFADLLYNWAGLGYVGKRGCWVQVYDLDRWVLTTTHELGHNLGLYHATAWNPSSSSPTGSGVLDEYGNYFDNMAGAPVPEGVFGSNLQFVLGWLPTDSYTTVTANGIYRLYRMDGGDSLTPGRPYSLRIPSTKQFNKKTVDYWIDFRQRFAGNLTASDGVIVGFGDLQGKEKHNILLDMTPLTNDFTDAALPIGRTYQDSERQVFITPLLHHTTPLGSESIEVAVYQGTFPDNRPPIGDFASIPSVKAWQVATLSVAASDPDGDPLAFDWRIPGHPRPVNASSRTVIFPQGGPQTVAVDLSDCRGGRTTLSREIDVTDPALQFSLALSGSVPLRLGTDGRRASALGGKLRWQSVDGSAWTSQEVAVSAFAEGNPILLGMAHAGSRTVIVGQDFDSQHSRYVGHIQSSLDGSHWQVHSSGLHQALEAVAEHQGVWVAVGKLGSISCSNNGLDWSPCPPVSSATLRTVLGVDRGWLAAGEAGTLLWSHDGRNWQSLPTGSTFTLRSLTPTHLPDVFLACGDQRRFTITWLPNNSPTITRVETTPDNILAVWYADGLYYQVFRRSLESSQSLNFLARSTDTATWVENQLAFTAPPLQVLFFEGVILISTTNGQLWSSQPIYDALDRWLIARFHGADRFHPDLAALTADPDGNGWPNLLEWALGWPAADISPALLPSSGRWTATSLPHEPVYSTFSFRRRKGYTNLGLQYIPEVSRPFSQWQSTPEHVATIGIVDNGDDTETVTVRSLTPLLEGQAEAWRLRVRK